MVVNIIQVGGFFSIAYKIDDSDKKELGSQPENSFNLEGNEVITFTDRLVKKCIIDLKDYDKDINIYVFTTPSAFRGMVSAIVVNQDSFIDIKNI